MVSYVVLQAYACVCACVLVYVSPCSTWKLTKKTRIRKTGKASRRGSAHSCCIQSPGTISVLSLANRSLFTASHSLHCTIWSPWFATLKFKKKETKAGRRKRGREDTWTGERKDIPGTAKILKEVWWSWGFWSHDYNSYTLHSCVLSRIPWFTLDPSHSICAPFPL